MSAGEALPYGWDETHLVAYRDGYNDALMFALEHNDKEIMEALECPSNPSSTPT